MIKAVGFDMDHTLSDRYKTLEKLVGMMGERFPFSMAEEEAAALLCRADRAHPYSFADKFEAFCAGGAFAEPPSFEEYRDFWWQKVGEASVDYPFTKGVLSELRAKGLKLALITNGDRAMQNDKIEVLGYRPYFDEVIISGEVGVAKPTPEIYELALRRLGVSAEEFVYVGDNPANDIEGARAAGIRAVWVKTVGRWPEHLPLPAYSVDTIAQIPALLEEMEG